MRHTGQNAEVILWIVRYNVDRRLGMTGIEFASVLFRSIEGCLADNVGYVSDKDVSIMSMQGSQGIHTTISRDIEHIGNVTVIVKQPAKNPVSMTLFAHAKYNKCLDEYKKTGYHPEVWVTSTLEKELLEAEIVNNENVTDDELIDEFFGDVTDEERAEIQGMMDNITDLVNQLREAQSED
jgi:hypothetical protein